MVNETSTPRGDGATQNWKDFPIDWEALEDAFENNAPEVHSYLHVPTGDVLRIVDGIADPQMHARIAADPTYLRIEPVSSREQYRWMERYIPMVEDPDLQDKLNRAIDGKGAFRRFKDVLMSYGPERERWFAFRSERLRIFMEAWLNAHALNPVKRPAWAPELAPSDEAAAATPALPNDDGERPSQLETKPRRSRSAESLRRQLRDIVESLGPRELDQLAAFGEFLRVRRASSRHPAADSQASLPAGEDIEDKAPESVREPIVPRDTRTRAAERAEAKVDEKAPVSEKPASVKVTRRKVASS
jgi:hypothetical protein